MEKDILKISCDGEKVSVSVGDPENIVKVVTELLIRQMSEGDSNGILLLNAIVIQLLAHELSGELEKDFLKSIRENVPVYRECYAEMDKEGDGKQLS